MKTKAFLPLVTYPQANSDAVVENAIGMARAFSADLHVLGFDADIPPIPNALSRFLLDVPELVRQAETMSQENGTRLLKAFADHSGKAGGPVVTQDRIAVEPADLFGSAAVRARYFDVVLLGWEAENSTARSVAETVVFSAGRPTVLMPEAHRAGSVNHLAVAWDGSRVAARAAGDVAALLAQAKQVSVLTVTDDKSSISAGLGERFAQGLEERGLAAKFVPLTRQGKPIAACLQEAAMTEGADLLVMGGYGHARLRDFVLGGATEGVLDELKLPVLLSH